MCIRDRVYKALAQSCGCGKERKMTNASGSAGTAEIATLGGCLLYTSDAADERSSVDLGGGRIIKKKNNRHNEWAPAM